MEDAPSFSTYMKSQHEMPEQKEIPEQDPLENTLGESILFTMLSGTQPMRDDVETSSSNSSGLLDLTKEEDYQHKMGQIN